MKLVTVATHSDRYFPLFIKSLKKHNIDYKILGWNDKWKGYSWRFTLLYDYIKTLPDDEIILFTDAFDCILLTNLDEIEYKFKQMNIDFLISTDGNRNIIADYLSTKVFGKCKGQLLNAGLYIGYVRKLKTVLHELLTDYVKNDSDDDQTLFTNYCLVNNDIHIDTKCNLFFNYNSMFHNIKYTIKNKRIYIPKYNTYPCVFGFPGCYKIISKKNNNMLSKLGYKCDQKYSISEYLKEIVDCLKRIIYYTKVVWKEFIILVVILSVIISLCM